MHSVARTFVLALAAASLLAACGPRRAVTAVLSADRAEKRLGAHADAPSVALVTSETGSIAALDIPAARGAQLAFERHAAKRGAHAAAPTLRIFDAASTAAGASRAADAALAAPAAGGPARPVAAMGLSDTDLALTAVPPFTRANIPFVVVGATLPDLPARCGPGTFLACFGDDAQGRAAAEFARSRFGARLAIVFDSRSVYARTVSGFCRDRFREAGGTVAMEFDLAATPAVQLGAFMTGLQDKVDAVYVACEPGDVAPVLASVRPVLPTMPIIGGDAFDCAAVLQSGSRPSTKVFFTTHAWYGPAASAEAIAFAEAYRARWGEPPPSAFAALGYDAANVMLEAIDRAYAAGNLTDPEAVRSEIAATRAHAGASGTIDFSRGAVPAKDVWVIEVTAGTKSLAQRVSPPR
jgi:branched-chain amino acid transport system substrate-binding protein